MWTICVLIFLITSLCPTRSAHILGSTLKPTLGKENEDIRLLDIVLLASVNRTSGHKLWSMSSAGGDVPSNLSPLVRTKHVEVDPDITDDDSAHQESLRDVYVMATPTSPLQPLSFSMAQLVELSPLKFAREDDERAFVGKKETSLLSIELETGRTTLTLDELEDYTSHNEPPRPTRVFIGRTDYHVSIYTRSSSPSGRKPPVQNLSFSAYGPNNQDNDMQTKYRRTSDNTYIHSLPNGNVFSFKATEIDSNDPYHLRQPQILWVLSLDSPIVAVCDDAFVLMQPRPPITDVLLFGDISIAQLESFYNPDTAYVGLVSGTGSLFMMSNDHYPLIGFGDTEYSPNWPLLDSGPSSNSEGDLPDNIDSESPFDARCLTGKRRLDLSGLSSRQAWRCSLYTGRNIVTGSEEARASGVDDIASLTPNLNSIQDTKGFRDGFNFKLPALGSMLLAIMLGAIWVLKEKLPSNRFAGFAPTLQPKGTVDADGPVSPFPPADYPSLTPETPPPHNGAAESFAPPQVSLSATDTPAPSAVFTTQRRQSVHFAELPEVQDIPDNAAGVATETGEESEKEGDAGGTPKKRKAPRRRRGKKGKGNQSSANGPADDGGAPERDEGNGNAVEENKANNYSGQPPISLVVPSTPNPVTSSLVVSDAVLGFGSHGTVVFRGSLQGRPVAVKRLLQDFVTLASREVSILQESDDHPNVVRYYYQEAQANFLYIALELCPATLADVIENPDQHHDIVVHFDPKRALRQITSGLRHLHSLKIVHRDIKPQNILISGPKQGTSSKDGGRRMLISDFGLCKKLDVDQTSFLPTAQGAQAAGTVGWRAPEILRGEVKLDDSADDTSQSSRGSVNTIVGGSSSGKTKLTKSVDIFSLGCLFYYVLTNGSHPFGDRFEREVNIIKNVKNLDGLDHFGEEGTEAVDLITKMLDPDACNRPNTTRCLLHPFFWDPGRRLHFLQDASDRFEIMCRDPRDQNLVKLETNALDIVGQDWHSRLDKVFIETLGKFRKDLLRALRNKVGRPHSFHTSIQVSPSYLCLV
ncbi:hypothetical protein F5J12DRAFT_816521 [Pisolithus orientalis]|uniref:uncharacterized protein n=1 Tax=Pisolithus orientalis TaxID=936130 RepID=UPI0022250F15|nr:uncharacterized protein F5J12DRAFT_816521 [Pisolithus orientalis]KAI6015195.1 hypothetical protein F5J12DRAFT_816521 [Pisolithus orientalis]